jgi:hypothetical protein
MQGLQKVLSGVYMCDFAFPKLPSLARDLKRLEYSHQNCIEICNLHIEVCLHMQFCLQEVRYLWQQSIPVKIALKYAICILRCVCTCNFAYPKCAIGGQRSIPVKFAFKYAICILRCVCTCNFAYQKCAIAGNRAFLSKLH